MADPFLEAQLTAVEAQITAATADLTALNLKAYLLDDGQSTERSDKQDADKLQRRLTGLFELRTQLRGACGYDSPTQVVMV